MHTIKTVMYLTLQKPSPEKSDSDEGRTD
jgi:hypothetical protein